MYGILIEYCRMADDDHGAHVKQAPSAASHEEYLGLFTGAQLTGSVSQLVSEANKGCRGKRCNIVEHRVT